ncbi:MAG: hypothetical protein ACYDDI_06515 [Candidatus Acidiferrales bacterium]
MRNRHIRDSFPGGIEDYAMMSRSIFLFVIRRFVGIITGMLLSIVPVLLLLFCTGKDEAYQFSVAPI